MTKQKSVTHGLLFTVLLLSACGAQAVTLTVVPDNQTVLVSSTLSVDLVISGLVDSSAPSLGTYDVVIGYDPTILSFTNVVFGDPVLGNQLDLPAVGTLTSVTPGLGTVAIFELSLSTSADLDALQADSFQLATVSFRAIGQGTSQLEINVQALGDAAGSPLFADVITASVAAVPEPSTVMLLGLGLILLPGFAYYSSTARPVRCAPLPAPAADAVTR